MPAQIAATERSSSVCSPESVGPRLSSFDRQARSNTRTQVPLTDANRRLVADGELATKLLWDVSGRQLYRPKVWASLKSIVTRLCQLPAMLTVSTDPLSAAKSAAKATADASTRSLDNPRSKT
jgi:hypothetical protein